LCDRDSLWPLLVAITAHKGIDLLRRERCLKRGGLSPAENDPTASEPDLEEIVGREPTPEFALQVAEECQRLLRTVALWKLEGYTVEEIAAKLGCVPRTVERKLRAIRKLWEKESPS
jgi:DNA-directed RNA polymerase specialized sigma24 family protein